MVTIWHNPKCATSRKVLEMIRAEGIEPRVIRYVKTPPSAPEINAVLKEMGLKRRDLLRRSG
jgi:arsenate reductase (glutaredoxin)